VHSKRKFATVYKNFINGKWVESKGKNQFEIINPAT